MKKLVLLCLLLFVSLQFKAQDFNKIANTELKVLADYKKAEPDVLKTVDFLLRTPAKPETDNRIIATAFVVKWMSGTDYTFSLVEDSMKISKGNPTLLAMYMACLTKVALDNPGQKFSENEMHQKATEILANYCANKKNKLKPSKALKKIIKKMKKN